MEHDDDVVTTVFRGDDVLLRLWFFVLRLFGQDPRGIFWIWDGRGWKGIDPLVAARSLLNDPEFDWEATPVLTNDEDPKTVADALRICAEAARRAFGLRDITAGGLTEAECCRVLFSFRDYLGDVKKNGSGPPTSPEPTGATPSETSAPSADSASGSTGIASDSNEPGTSGRE